MFYVNPEKTSEIQKLAADAQWFEDRMPWDPEVPQDRASRASPPTPSTSSSRPATPGPVTPIGINLPNDQRVREQHGSKSVSLSNINEAYDKSTLPEFRTEFSWTPEEAERATKWGALAGELTTNMHEVIGHASGKVEERLKGNPQAALKEQFSALEEGARRPGRAVFPAGSEDGRAAASSRGGPRRRSSGPSTRATRATRWSSCGGSGRARSSKKTTCATGR